MGEKKERDGQAREEREPEEETAKGERERRESGKQQRKTHTHTHTHTHKKEDRRRGRPEHLERCLKSQPLHLQGKRGSHAGPFQDAGVKQRRHTTLALLVQAKKPEPCNHPLPNAASKLIKLLKAGRRINAHLEVLGGSAAHGASRPAARPVRPGGLAGVRLTTLPHPFSVRRRSGPRAAGCSSAMYCPWPILRQGGGCVSGWPTRLVRKQREEQRRAALVTPAPPATPRVQRARRKAAHTCRCWRAAPLSASGGRETLESVAAEARACGDGNSVCGGCTLSYGATTGGFQSTSCSEARE